MPTRWHAFRSVSVWAAATLAGMGVCWWGVRPVLDAAVPDRLVAFPTVSRAPALVPPPPATSSASPRPVRHSTSPGAPPSSPAAPPSGTTAAPQPTLVDGWTRFPDGHYTQTFQLVGGTATLSAAAGRIELVAATPKPGNVMTVGPPGAATLVVTFTGLRLQVSTVEASWADDRPAAKVTELP
jgi:hypothetical protein